MNLDKYESLLTKGSNQQKLFNYLKDQKWHCRSCLRINDPEIAKIKQVAGGGGIQGLQRGTKSRPGIEINTIEKVCDVCGESSKFDRWTGNFQKANVPSSISEPLANRILDFYNYTDSIEERKRPKHELIIDHRFPMERWGDIESINDEKMSDEDIRNKFQLLKKDSSGNHNLLKSRSCEHCIKTGKRGMPLNIPYWYKGGSTWNPSIPVKGPDAEQGCVGCGWYDYKKWKDSLCSFLEKYK